MPIVIVMQIKVTVVVFVAAVVVDHLKDNYKKKDNLRKYLNGVM